MQPHCSASRISSGEVSQHRQELFLAVTTHCSGGMAEGWEGTPFLSLSAWHLRELFPPLIALLDKVCS